MPLVKIDDVTKVYEGKVTHRAINQLGFEVEKGEFLAIMGPSGSGKSHLARRSGLPVLCLDEFYKDGDDPSCPRHADLGIVDWDDPRAWDANAAMSAIEQICHTGSAEVPRYDISADRAIGAVTFDAGNAPAFGSTPTSSSVCSRSGATSDSTTRRSALLRDEHPAIGATASTPCRSHCTALIRRPPTRSPARQGPTTAP